MLGGDRSQLRPFEEVLVYPNPAPNGRFAITATTSTKMPLEVTISTLDGKILKRYTTTNKTGHYIPESLNAKGMFIVNLRGLNTSYNINIIAQ